MAMSPVSVGRDAKRRMDVDLDPKSMEGISIGSKVRVITTGVVTELRAPEKWMDCCDGEEKERITPPRMCVQVDGTKVAVVGNEQIDSLVEDEETEEYD